MHISNADKEPMLQTEQSNDSTSRPGQPRNNLMKPFNPLEPNGTKLLSKKRGLGLSPRAWFSLLVALPGLLVIHLLRLASIKVNVYPDHFGHQGLDIEYYLRTHEKQKRRCIYVFSNVIPNEYLLSKHRELLRIIKIPKKLYDYIRKVQKTSITTFGVSALPWVGFERKILDTPVWSETSPQIKFSDKDHIRGQKIMASLGIIPGEYVGFTARGPFYYIQNNTQKILDRNSYLKNDVDAANKLSISQQSSLHQQFRNHDFTDFWPALKFITDTGLASVRLGASEDQDLSKVLPSLIDFSGGHRDRFGAEGEFADVYLMHHCKFLIAGPSGLVAFSHTANKPVLLVNSFPWPWITIPPCGHSIYTPKLWRDASGRIFTFSEMIQISREIDWRVTYNDSFFENHNGLHVIDNTPEEILAASEEMYLRVMGQWEDSPADIELHEKLMKHADPTLPMFHLPSRMATTFLRKHRDLLD